MAGWGPGRLALTTLEHVSEFPPDAERLRVLAMWLGDQVERARAAVPGAAPERQPGIQAVEQYLSHQLGRVRMRLYDAEQPVQPPDTWWMQHLPAGGPGGTGRGLVHHGGCWSVKGATQISREEAAVALTDDVPHASACDACRPQRALALRHSRTPPPR